MDVVEIFLMCLVASSVLMFLIIDYLNSFEKQNKSGYVSAEINSVVAEQNVVCGDGVAENFEGSTTEEQNIGGDEIPESFGGSTTEEQSIGKNLREETAEEEQDERVVCTELGFRGEGEGEFGDDDWEGIERTELEKIFGSAIIFCDSNADQISAGVKMELYGLQRVALEGPCHGSQPMALNVPARAKWNAWQKVGDMSREAAMEKYIETLDKEIPGWKGEDKADIGDAAAAEDLTS